jgi:Mg2+ and Co2+ transporter CorA
MLSGGAQIHFERTLHASYYPGLGQHVLDKRNKDQVVFRWAKEHGKRREERPVLVVPQLWLWRVDNSIISACSSFTKMEESPMYERVSADQEYGKDGLVWRFDPRDRSPDSLLGALLADRIIAFGKPRDENVPLILDIYEETIFGLVSDVADYMEEDVTVPNIGEETNFLKTVTQLRSELAMIFEIFEQQKQIVDSFLLRSDFYDPKEQAFKVKEEPTSISEPTFISERGRVDWMMLLRARRLLDKDSKRAEKVDRDAERIAQSIKDQLDLKRTHASIRDARSSLVLGVAVASFTVVTIIFTPLAFLTSLFALPIDQFVHQQYEIVSATDPNDKVSAYRSSYIRQWFSKFDPRDDRTIAFGTDIWKPLLRLSHWLLLQ